MFYLFKGLIGIVETCILDHESSLVSALHSSGPGRVEAGGEKAPYRGESGATQEGGDGENPPEPSGAHRGRVGADPVSDRGPPTHQRSGRPMETEPQISGKEPLFIFHRHSSFFHRNV